MGATEEAQDAVNQVIDGAQKLANKTVDLGEDVLHEALAALVAAQQKVIDVLVGKSD